MLWELQAKLPAVKTYMERRTRATQAGEPGPDAALLASAANALPWLERALGEARLRVDAEP